MESRATHEVWIKAVWKRQDCYMNLSELYLSEKYFQY